ncbi:MAG: hypothetical protein JNM70_25875, partial [Anaerolineae bacterium]|nr:hypothetical protein [Anaerolineae bacterium]
RAILGPAAALLAGVAQTFAFAPFEAWWLQIAALALLVYLARDARPGRAALLGWAFATGWLTSGLWWLYISLHDYGGLASWLAAIAVLGVRGYRASVRRFEAERVLHGEVEPGDPGAG